MKKLFSLLLAASAVVSGSVFGSLGSCDWSNCCDWFDGDVYVYGDWLYWNLRRSGLDYVVPTFVPEGFVGDGTCFKKTEVGFNSGYRVGIGYKSRCQWGFDLNYTHYTGSDFDSFVAGTANGAPTRGASGVVSIISEVASANMRYDVGYKVLDAVVGYEIETCCYGTFRPFLGGRFAWIDEKDHTFYQSTTATNTYTIDATTDSKAYGLLMGIDYSNLVFCDRFGFFANFGAAVMYGDVEARSDQTSTATFPVTPIRFLVCENRILSALDIAVGLEGLIFQWCGFSLEGRVGYEFHQWINMIDFINLTGSLSGLQARNNACFGMDGLFIRLKGSY